MGGSAALEDEVEAIEPAAALPSGTPRVALGDDPHPESMCELMKKLATFLPQMGLVKRAGKRLVMSRSRGRRRLTSPLAKEQVSKELIQGVEWLVRCVPSELDMFRACSDGAVRARVNRSFLPPDFGPLPCLSS